MGSDSEPGDNVKDSKKWKEYDSCLKIQILILPILSICERGKIFARH